jgi:hypothetical protein
MPPAERHFNAPDLTPHVALGVMTVVSVKRAVLRLSGPRTTKGNYRAAIQLQATIRHNTQKYTHHTE